MERNKHIKKIIFEKALNYKWQFSECFDIVRNITYSWVKGGLWQRLERLLTPNTTNQLCERHVWKGWNKHIEKNHL